MQRVVVAYALVALLAACKGDQPSAASGAGTASGSAAAPAPSPEPTPPPAPPPVAPAAPAVDAGPRPPGVSDERLAAADRFAAAAEQLGAAVSAAGADCQKIVVAVEANATAYKDAKAEVERIRGSETKDATVSEWFKARYANRMLAALGPLTRAAKTCLRDQAFVATMKNLQLMGRRVDPTPKPLDGSGSGSAPP